MIPTGESIIYSSNKFEPYKLFHNCPKTNVLNKDSNFKNYDEILKNQLMKKKEKYSIDCPLCKAKVMPFRIDFTNVVFVCVNQEVNKILNIFFLIFFWILLKSAQYFTSIHQYKPFLLNFY